MTIEMSSVTLCIAVIGAVLGVLNTWNSLERQRVNLRVRPGYAFTPINDRMVQIEVVNLSAFAVTVSNIGFERQDGSAAFYLGKLTNGQSLPHRLESRESIAVLVSISELNQKAPGKALGKAFAKTSCGELFRGDSAALKQIKAGSLPELG